MAFDLQRSVFPVTGADAGKSAFGTAFVFHRACKPDRLYLLTCAHVVRDIERSGRVQIYPYLTRVIAITAPDDTDDLAIIEVSNSIPPEIPLTAAQQEEADAVFHRAEPLVPANFGSAGMPCIVGGYYAYISRKEYKLKTLPGTLAGETAVKGEKQPHATRTWDLNFSESVALRPGYSGSPVIDTAKEMVVGIVRIKEDAAGRRGLAVSVEALPRLAGRFGAGHEFLKAVIETMAQPGYGAERLPDTAQPKNINSYLIPYLADRKEQLSQLSETVRAHLSKIDAAPIVGILHGADRQAHERFIDCLEKHYWKVRRMTEVNAPAIQCKHIGLPWVRFADYEAFSECMLKELKLLIPQERSDNFETVARAFNHWFNQPVMLHTQVHSDEWQHSDGKILEYFIRFWGSWPRRRQGKVLIACLVIKYVEPPPQKGFLGRLLNRGARHAGINRKIRDELAGLAGKSFGDVQAAVFDELRGIDRRMAENWAQMEVVRAVCGAHDFLPFIRDLYDAEKELCMETFAKKIHEELKTLLPSSR
jgi:hypothetical protein